MLRIGTIVRGHRLQRNLTQAELATALGSTSQTAVSQLESGRDTWLGRQRFHELAELFDYPSDLIEWWVDDRQTKIEEEQNDTRRLRDALALRSGRGTVVDKVEKLIEQNRRANAELVELRRQLLAAE